MKKILWGFGLLLLLLAALLVGAAWQVKRSLANAGVHGLHVDFSSVAMHRLQFQRLSFVYRSDSAEQFYELHNVVLKLRWPAWFSPQLTDIAVSEASVAVPDSAQQKTPAESEPLRLPESWSLPDAFPARVQVDQIHALLVCPAAGSSASSELCPVAGALALHKKADSLSLNLRLSPGETLQSEHQLQVIGKYRLRNDLPELSARLLLDKTTDIQWQTSLVDEGIRYWHSSIEGRGAYPDTWWQSALAPWHIVLPVVTEQSLTQPVQLDASWQLAVQPLLNGWNSGDLRSWLSVNPSGGQISSDLTGRLSLNANLPEAIGVRGLGQFSGQLALDVQAKAGKIQRYQLDGLVRGSELAPPPTWQKLGLTASSAELLILSKASENVSFTSLPLSLALKSSAPDVSGQVTAQLLIDALHKTLTLQDGRIKAQAKHLQPAQDFALENLQLDLPLAGSWQENAFTLRLTAPASLQADILAPTFALNATGVKIQAEQLALAGPIEQQQIAWRQVKLDAAGSVSVSRLTYPQLIPKSWLWQGEFHGLSDSFALQGDLSIDSRLTITHTVERDASAVTARWKMGDVFLLAGNPFAAVLQAWPPLLELAQGKILGSGSLTFDLDKQQLRSHSALQLNAISGLYDTTVFKGLTAPLTIDTKGESLSLRSDALVLQELNKGFSLGPFHAAGSYAAEWGALTEGMLTVTQFTGGIMGGTMQLGGSSVHSFDFSQPAQNFMLTVEELDLATLLRQYPSAELSGSGRISGTIPLQMSAKGIQVMNGSLSAEEPGGRLQYDSARAQALAKSQPSMKLITDALADFHYSVLRSGVTYDENGKLLLSLTLNGKNPDLEKGRPINFNINLEEDLPALIASIQLSSKVSDMVKKRLQERLAQRNAAKANAASSGGVKSTSGKIEVLPAEQTKSAQ